MRVSLVTLLSVFAISCGIIEIDRNQRNVPPPQALSPDAAENPSGTKKLTLELIGINEYSLNHFLLADNKLIGIGAGKSNELGWAYLSEDTGKSWRPTQILGMEEPVSINGLFAKDQRIWFVGDEGTLVSGSLGSEGTWKFSQVPADRLRLISWIDEHVGIIVTSTDSGCEVLRTIDGGGRWTKVYSNPTAGNPFDIITSGKTVLVAMNDEYILASADAGETWEARFLIPISSRSSTPDRFVLHDDTGAASLAQSPNQRIWVVGEKGSIFYSDDAGVSWRSLRDFPVQDPGLQFKSIAFSPKGSGVILAKHQLFFSSNFGASWKELLSFPELPSKRPGAPAEKDEFVEVRFVGDKAIILGKKGVYSISF